MISRCQQDEYACTHTTRCRFHQIYDEISSVVRTKLDSYTFDVLVGAVADTEEQKNINK